MNKERLEEAKKLIKHYHEQKRSNNVMLTERGVELIEHLYEQTERVQELEEQNKRYREALEKIARINIDQGTVTVSEVHAVLTARNALEGEE